MATKDYRRAEKKKPKKATVKSIAPVLNVPVEVQVAKKKGKKSEEFPEEGD